MQKKVVENVSGNVSKRFIDLAEILRRFPLSRSTVYRLIGAHEFPAGIKISKNRRIWSESSITEFIAAKVAGKPSPDNDKDAPDANAS